LIGPSGCGKTTTLRLIAGLIRPDAGKLMIYGTDYTNVPTYKRPISMVFQNWALFPHLTVYENVAFGPRMHGVSQQALKDEVKDALRLVRMEEYAQRKPRELSGGQQQRVGIARALVVKPEIILLDEPLGNLDFKLQLQLQIELAQLHKELGGTFVYVTHDQRQAVGLGNRICVMNNGHIEQLDASAAIYSTPANVFVAKFVGESNIVEGRVTHSDERGSVIDTILGPFKFKGGSHAEGKKVWLFWRPENSLIGTESQGADYTFDCLVKSVQTSGQVTHYELEVDSTNLKVVKTGLPDPTVQEQTRTRVGVKGDQIVMLDKVSSIASADVERTLLGA